VLKNRLKQLLGLKGSPFFITWPISILINPFYIIRNGIYQQVLSCSGLIRGKVLDIGCGSRPYECLFFNAESYIGVEIEVSGHDNSGSNVDFFYDGRTLPFGPQEYDSVVCFEVFEHVFNINELLCEVHRVLKDDGLLLFSVPFAWNEHEAPYDFARYTSYGLSHLLISNGFEVLKLTKTTTYVLALCQMWIAYIYQHVFSRYVLIRRLSLVLVFPLNVIAMCVDFVLPKRYQYFSNCVILAKKQQLS